MKDINLIDPTRSDVNYTIILFPDGELHFKFLEELDHKETYSITCRVTNANELFLLLQVGRILKRHAVKFNIVITYLMSMRMDRVISFEEDYTLELVASAINSLNAEYVLIYTPHSDKTMELINHSKEVDYTVDIAIYNNLLDCNILYCFPDKGALNRYIHLRDANNYITLSKKRDLDTGKILSLEVDEFHSRSEKENYKEVLVIDDLCDGGGTFMLTANKLRELYPDAKLTIVVTHLVNPIGLVNLSNTYDKVYISDSYKDWDVSEFKNVILYPCLS